MRYVDTFMSLRSSADVLNVVNPLGSKATKEITESMAIFQKLRKIVLKNPMKYSLLDLCAGNALTSVLSIHVLPITHAVAVDKRPRTRKWENVKRFEYQNVDIFRDDIFRLIDEKTIICAVHPCSSLAERTAEIYLNSPAPYLILMPCCEGQAHFKGQYLKQLLGTYGCWCLHLAEKVNGEIHQDKHCISPKNIVILAKKEWV